MIGRWLSTDPYGEFWSPYVGMGNDPVNNTDPDGGCTKCDSEDKAVATQQKAFLLDSFTVTPFGNHLDLGDINFASDASHVNRIDRGRILTAGETIIRRAFEGNEAAKDILRRTDQKLAYQVQFSRLHQEAGETYNDFAMAVIPMPPFLKGVGMISRTPGLLRLARMSWNNSRFVLRSKPLKFNLLGANVEALYRAEHGLKGGTIFHVETQSFKFRLDWHNLSQSSTPINQRFFHYHHRNLTLPSGTPNNSLGRHLQIGTGINITNSSQLRRGWFGVFY